MVNKSFGQAIEKRRRELGLTQEMVAKKVTVKANYIGYLERGMRHPSQKVVEKLSAALKLDPQELYLLVNPKVRTLLGVPKAASSGGMALEKIKGDCMLTAYVAKALEHATFEGPGEGRWYGEIPLCPGVWATGASKEECRRELQEVLEGWLILKLRDNDPDIPTIDGIGLDVVEMKEYA